MKNLIFTTFLMLFLILGICFTYCTEADETVIFGGYCYYIENGDIYRAPMTDLAGETELFREDSLSIILEGTDLISLSSDGNIAIYSLISDNDLIFEANQYKSTNNDELLLGSLSAKYESNGNPAAISKGNDAGGVSFGAYQFASNAGVPKAFADWCISSGTSPEIGNRLLSAYKNDGSACGDSFKAEWLSIAKENSDLFLSVQHRYVKEKYYDAIVARIEKNVPGFDMDIYGIALRNVFWSRSVQHGVGGSYNVITRAFEVLGGYNMQSEEVLIRAIYAESGAVVDAGTYPMTGTTAESLGIAGKYMKYYSKNSSAVQISVYKRLNINELALALEMLEKYGGFEPPVGIDYEFIDLVSSEISENSAIISATLKNYKQQSISEYGLFIGKSLNSLVDIPLFVGSTSVHKINLSEKFTNSLESGTTYYFGAYAFIGDEYVTSDIFTFKTLNLVKYKVSYLDYDGSLLYETTVKKGDNAIFIGEIPVRKQNAQYSYIFEGWDKDGKNITSDIVINAVYIENDHLWDGNTSDSFASGDGTAASPYEISSPDELAHLSLLVLNGFKTDGKFFELSNNIVLGYVNPSKHFNPIGTEENPFSGTFIGNGYKIIGLNVSEGIYCGLFGVICGAKIESLIIEDAEINGEISGILAGKIIDSSSCIISNCSFVGNVVGNEFAGGIVGYCAGNASFNDIFFSGKVSANVCGGLFGCFNNSMVERAFCISVTDGEKNDAICASFFVNSRFTDCYYSDEDISLVGKSLNSELLKKESSYLGFDFSRQWTLNDGHAILNLAKENKFQYYKYGDANGDGIINIIDSVFMAQHIAEWNLDLPRNFEKIADLNGDAIVSVLDPVILAQHLAGWNVSFII